MSKTITVDQGASKVQRLFQDPKWYLSGRSYHVRVRAQTMQTYLRGAQFHKLLDIGCGDGTISLPLLTPERRLTLLDLSEAMLTIARKNVPAELHDCVETIQGEFLGAELTPSSYDLVMCLGVLAYIESPGALMEKLADIVKPNGTLMVECTDFSHFIGRLTLKADAIRGKIGKPIYRTVIHSAAGIVAGFEAAGFELRNSFRYTAPGRLMRLLFPQSWLYRWICLVYGTAARPRNQWLGNECIFQFVRKEKQTH